MTPAARCVNCGRREATFQGTLCETCRAAFPGTPEDLHAMIEAFRHVLQFHRPGQPRSLSPDEQKTVEEFMAVMREKVIPEIVKTMNEREENKLRKTS